MIWGVYRIADISTGADTRTLGRFGSMFLYVKHPIVLRRQRVYSGKMKMRNITFVAVSTSVRTEIVGKQRAIKYQNPETI